MIARSFDYRIIKRLLSWRVIPSSEIIYLEEWKAVQPVGVWSLHRHADGLMIHADMSPACRGKDAARSAVNAFDWVAKNTPHRKIYARIAKAIKHACRLAVLAGMTFAHEDDEYRWYTWAA